LSCLLSAKAQDAFQEQPGREGAELAKVRRLIEKLDSPKFSERETAVKELRRIGELALMPLRESILKGKGGLEFRRRAQQAVRVILDDSIDRLINEAAREGVERGNQKKSAEIVQHLADLWRERSASDGATNFWKRFHLVLTPICA
jgi:hypothetical protein